ncbi:DUF3298 and DUF4163 domain-containing protein [Terrimonas sp. NA20]|uniref:DUF3298 and DUF4163 domain-containing protein n=1 Tax=Terrimonas ginsenosidimutans TaxID=2908004 RepID=A0ABS9KMY6_9BACT|nr:DUF3298 and DUF4163 domain-containing protein [Terrimonas ginsenosidimutans]MCG2613686.1 DUF3298 and DUF4163 domain-containing protein [Terrimonas ginsenosidimutans]
MVNFRYVLAWTLLLFMGANAAAQGKYWYKSFSGTIDKYPFTLHLHRMDHGYTGYYYYTKAQRPIYLSGDDTTTAGKIRLQAYVPGTESDYETFTLDLKGDSLTGAWIKDHTGNQDFPVKAGPQTAVTLSFDYVVTSGSEKLRPKLGSSPGASYEAATVWPKGNSGASVNLKKILQDLMYVKGTGDIGPLLLAQKKRFFADYYSTHKNVPDSELVEFTSGYTEDQTTHTTVMYHSGSILTLANMSYAYTGGAHGNYGTHYASVNPATGKAYKLADVLSPAGKKALNSLIDKNFRKERELSAKESLKEAGLFEDTITANENFFLTGSGIGFNYVPYEIGPYAMGEVIVFIPYTDFGQGGLNPSFKK